MSDIVTGRIGARIRECRLAAGMTQEELAGDIITRNMLLGKKSRRRYIHSVFHLFVVFGSIMHMFMILFFIV